MGTIRVVKDAKKSYMVDYDLLFDNEMDEESYVNVMLVRDYLNNEISYDDLGEYVGVADYELNNLILHSLDVGYIYEKLIY